MKSVIVTGSEGQLGKVYVNRLLERGCEVIGFDLAETAHRSDIEYCCVDISNPESIEGALGDLGGKIDVLINNAGVSVFSPFEERTLAELDFVIDVNLKGTLLMCQAVFNTFFKQQNSGCIVNVGSIYGLVAGDMRIYKEGDRRTPEIYGATKAAVINLTQYFAAYMAPYNIRVNCISPGGVFNYQDREFVDKYSAKVPLGRMGNEEELLSTLEYLISDESTYITGQNIIVDGGLTVW
jgi:NAD(P)-dependent dehydrogenase (short-subunit alcohol dehydrogenase family)